MNKPDYKKIRDAVFALCERNAREVAQLYDNAITEIAELMKGIELDETRPFSFEDYGLQDKVDEIMDRLEVSITNKVRDGVIAAYGMSYANCEALVKYAVGEHVAAKVKKAFLPKIRSRDAAIAFLKNVPTASGRLWNGETLALMTSAVEDSIRQGMSAGKMATQIKKYLLDPDDWHRRFRYKVGEDEEGNPIYGRKWKKREFDETTGKYHWVDHQPGEPHPGHVGGPGAYRSSYKNALRYARTTTNMAYRTADYNQYQDMPFVIGIEIKLSNNHPVPDICDDLAGVYPADFLWTGWHPNCRCYMVPVLAKKNEIDKMVDAILNDEDPNEVECDGVVTELPENFTAWAVKNKDRMEAAAERGTLPYFIRDNQRKIERTVGHIGNESLESTVAKDVSEKLAKAAAPREGRIYSTFEPVSTAIVSAVAKAADNRERVKIYESVMLDERAQLLHDVDGHRTTVFPGHMGTKKASWGATKKMAFELNEQGIDVAFLPEMPGKVSADSLIRTKKGVYHMADFKHATTTNSNTLSKDLAHGFEQAGTVVLKLEKMDVGQFRETIEYLKRNDIPFGNIILMNRYGSHLELTYRDIKSGRYKSKIKGFL